MSLVLLSAALLPTALGLNRHYQLEERALTVDGLLPWDEAEEKAARVLPGLSPQERTSLVHGSNSYAPGWYVGNTLPIPRLGLPALTMQDAGNGFRPHVPGTHGSTIMWPSCLALAATWDEGLVQSVAAAMGREFRGKGANVMLGPSVNVHRVASNGRNFEYLSGEDPYLGARLVKPFVRGVQGEGVMATAKHYAFNDQETNRGTGSSQDTSSSVVDVRTAWELYYPPFAAAVEAGAGAFMCSYNKVNGTHACENPDILNRDLKSIMGFRGFVMSDWGATHSTQAVTAGLDQDMPGGNDRLFLAADLASSYASAADEAVLRILAAMYHLRLDQRQGCQPPACIADMLKDQRTPESLQLAREAAAKSIVLLKNDGLLPLDAASVRTLAVIGIAASAGPSRELTGAAPDYYAGGGSGHVSAKAVVTPIEGIMGRAKAANVSVLFSPEHDAARAAEMARQADAVLVVGATTATEGIDRPSLSLDFGVDRIVDAVAPLRPTAVLMMTPGAVLTPWRNSVRAVANMFLGGEEAGHAWATVLFGDVAPEGRLPIMLPATGKDVLHPEAGPVKYAEGLFTSYRSKILNAAFPFGHGLSYTSFDYGPAVAFTEGCSGAACVRVAVSNTGRRSGTETAQAYVRFPPEAGEPDLVLRGFQKTRALQPGESEEVTFAFTARDLSIYTPDHGWVQQSGAQAHVGASSADIRRVVQL